MTILHAVIAIETILLIATSVIAVRFGTKLMQIEDVLEECLDILDKRYTSISKVLEIPLFYDSPEVRKVHEDIKAARDSILLVASTVAKIDETQEAGDER